MMSGMLNGAVGEFMIRGAQETEGGHVSVFKTGYASARFATLGTWD